MNANERASVILEKIEKKASAEGSFTLSRQAYQARCELQDEEAVYWTMEERIAVDTLRITVLSIAEAVWGAS
jgi:NOL1/NOP2/fmu family ribosome biogenesis protein